MRRRKFLKALSFGGMQLFEGIREMRDGAADPKHWMWLRWKPGTDRVSWQRLLARAKGSGIRAILPEVYNSERALYASAHVPSRERWLETLIRIARDEGLEIHAWMWMMPCNITEIQRDHPEWYAVNRRGEPSWKTPAYVDYYKFLCPTRPEVQSFLRANVTEVASYAGVTGVHLDYIRFPDVILARQFQQKYGIVQDREYPEYDYCYCEACVSAFAEQTGKDARAISDPASDDEWVQFRYDRITHLVNDVLIPAIHDRRKQVTAAVFPNWQSVRQQWTSWNIDGFLPMLYHGFYDQGIDWIGEQTAWGVGKLNGRAPLYAGLFVPHLKPDILSTAIDVSMKSGAAGVSLFNAEDMTDEHWKQLKSSVMR